MNYRFTLHNTPEERRSHQIRNGSLKSFQHSFLSTFRSQKMCLHREGCCSGNTLHFLSIDMLFKAVNIFKEVLLSFSRIFRDFREILSSFKLSSCAKLRFSVFFECRPELHPSSVHILWFSSVLPKICAIAPHYLMVASFQILSSSSFISLSNIQWYIIWET